MAEQKYIAINKVTYDCVVVVFKAVDVNASRFVNFACCGFVD